MMRRRRKVLSDKKALLSVQVATYMVTNLWLKARIRPDIRYTDHFTFIA